MPIQAFQAIATPDFPVVVLVGQAVFDAGKQTFCARAIQHSAVRGRASRNELFRSRKKESIFLIRIARKAFCRISRDARNTQRPPKTKQTVPVPSAVD